MVFTRFLLRRNLLLVAQRRSGALRGELLMESEVEENQQLRRGLHRPHRQKNIKLNQAAKKLVPFYKTLMQCTHRHIGVFSRDDTRNFYIGASKSVDGNGQRA